MAREKTGPKPKNLTDDPRDLATEISRTERWVEDETVDRMVEDITEVPSKRADFLIEDARSRVMGKKSKKQ